MSRCTVFPFRDFNHLSVARTRGRSRLHSLNRNDVAETERFEIRQLQSADRIGCVAECVASFVTVEMRIGKLAAANSVENYEHEFTFD
jgi:hypothetical protein